jgi:hypothetical protein
MRRMLTCCAVLCAALAVRGQNVDPCAEACRAEARAMLDKCLAAGMVPADCEARAAEFEQRCIAERCGTILPPDPVTCEQRCELAARAEYERCLANGGRPEACKERYTTVLNACLEANCNVVPPPPPPATCEERCELAAREALQACMANGGSDVDCKAVFAQTFDACIAANCQVDPPPVTTCEERCTLASQQMYDQCVAAGVKPEDCALKRDALLNDCIARSCNVEPPPPQPSCKDLCEQYANGIIRECLNAGASEEECWSRRQAALDACIAAKCSETPTDPPCEQQCYTSAKLAYEDCRANAGAEDVCRAAYETALAACLADTCGVVVPPPPEPTCEQNCYTSAKLAFDECLKDNGNEQECRAKYEETLRACLTTNCNIQPPPPPPEPTCEQQCYASAKLAVEECLAAGGTPEECRAKYQEAVRACLTENCNVEPPAPPEPPAPCDEDCTARANQFYEACLANGGSPDTCRAQADALLALCLVRCGNGPSCENRCAVAAQIVLTGCALGGVPTEECRQMANKVLESCMQGCVRPDGCGTECDRLAGRAREECAARGGSREECEVVAQEVLAKCREYCGTTPMPGCDVQCEDMAAEMAARCAEAGLTAEYCEAAKQRFLEACAANHGENCGQENLAALSVFKSFRRGDVNEDGRIDIADPINILQQLFAGRPASRCEDAVDANDDGKIDIADPVCVLVHLFGQNAQGLPAPYGTTGQDPTGDALLCQP